MGKKLALSKASKLPRGSRVKKLKSNVTELSLEPIRDADIPFAKPTPFLQMSEEGKADVLRQMEERAGPPIDGGGLLAEALNRDTKEQARIDKIVNPRDSVPNQQELLRQMELDADRRWRQSQQRRAMKNAIREQAYLQTAARREGFFDSIRRTLGED